MMENEFGGNIMTAFRALRAKMYAYKKVGSWKSWKISAAKEQLSV